MSVVMVKGNKVGKLLNRPDERVNAKGICTGVYIWSKRYGYNVINAPSEQGNKTFTR